MKYDYVFSGISCIGMCPSNNAMKFPDHFNTTLDIVVKGAAKMTDHINGYLKPDSRIDTSLLFNAFTERNYGTWVEKSRRFGLKNVYSDSGGLQAVTQGLICDDNFKRKVYEIQAPTDFSMCFDEIPCVKLSENAQMWSSNGKAYLPEKAHECAVKTAENIRDQIETFAELESDSQVFYIIQGNTAEDMVEWFDVGVEILEDWHWEHISGLALAGICAGPSMQETVNLMNGYHKIAQKYSDKYLKDQVHFLGIGAPIRILPITFLFNSGFMPTEKLISLDSTTFTKSLAYGRFFDRNGNAIPGDIYNIKPFVTEVLDFYYPIFVEHWPELDHDKLRNHFLTENRRWTDLHVPLTDPRERSMADAFRILISIHQMDIFANMVKHAEDGQFITKNRKTREYHAIMGLRNVRDQHDFNEWTRANHSWLSESQRVRRGLPSSLDDFFV